MRCFWAIFAVFQIVLSGHAFASVTVPSCNALEQWADTHIKTVIIGKGEGRDSETQNKIKEENKALFTDSATSSVFGRPYSQWSPDDAKAVMLTLESCKKAAVERGDVLMNRKLGSAFGTIHLNKDLTRVDAINYDKSFITQPDCTEVHVWADIFAKAPRGTSMSKRLNSMLSDAETQSLFGHAYSKWTVHDFRHANEIVSVCHRGTSGMTHTGLKAAMSEIQRNMNNMRGTDVKKAKTVAPRSKAPVQKGRGN